LPELLGADYVAQLTHIASDFGITHTGVAGAEVLQRARGELHRRRAAGLHDTMQFTYKNPDRSTDPSAAVRGARSVFVGARPYLVAADATEPDEPEAPASADVVVAARVAKYAQSDHYGPLREGLWAVAAKLRADGFKAVAFADDNSMVDREVAFEAGLGWYGKNANLLISGAGSFFVLGSVVTTAPLPANRTAVPDGCGTCRRCIDACPTAAIVAPGVIDAGRCLAWLLQKPGIFDRRFRAAVGDRLYGCDECQEVCPPTVHLGARRTVAVRPAAHEPIVDALELLDVSDEVVLQRWGRWYLADRDPRWLRRNALIIVGNCARPGEPSVVAALTRYLAHDDPILRAHAVWAARSLGLTALLPAHDPDPMVLVELNASL
jgi:epoxyqueuosine reductase